MHATRPIGPLLRSWRQRRHLSQLDLAVEADISARHVSFLETGRALPSREMLTRLCERLDIPLRDRNALMLAAGYAPMYPERSLDDPALKEARAAIEMVLSGHEPYPALAVDRHWTLISANRALTRFLTGISPDLLQPPVNVLRLTLHPKGIAPKIVNFAQWRAHVLVRLRHQADVTADPLLEELLKELSAYPAPERELQTHDAPRPDGYGSMVVPLKLQGATGVISLFSTTTVFGTPLDVTLSELAIESFFPADAETAQHLREVAER
jgi:transcriptional regulator with XRE-family HTH domain